MNWKPLHMLSWVSASVGAVVIPAGPENGIGNSSALRNENNVVFTLPLAVV
jgi:hypothetical protein